MKRQRRSKLTGKLDENGMLNCGNYEIYFAWSPIRIIRAIES